MAFASRLDVIKFLKEHGNNDAELNRNAQDLRDYLKKSTAAENGFFCYAALGILLSHTRDFSEAKIGNFLNNEWSAYLADCAIIFFSMKSPSPLLIREYLEGVALSVNMLNGIEEKLHAFFAQFYNYLDNECQSSLTKSQLESCISLGLYYFKQTQITKDNILDKDTHHNNGLKCGRSLEMFLNGYRAFDKETYDLRDHIKQCNTYYSISDDIFKYYRASLQCDDSDADSDYVSPPDSPMRATTPLNGTPLMLSKTMKRIDSNNSIASNHAKKFKTDNH